MAYARWTGVEVGELLDLAVVVLAVVALVATPRQALLDGPCSTGPARRAPLGWRRAAPARPADDIKGVTQQQSCEKAVSERPAPASASRSWTTLGAPAIVP